MKQISVYFLSFFFMLNLTSCISGECKILKEYCKEKNFEINFSNKIIIILVPVEGCATCISKSVEFMKIHAGYPYHYILSSIFLRNLKYISDQLPMKPEKIFYDFENTLLMKGLVNQIPKGYLVENNKIVLSMELATDNNYKDFLKAIDELLPYHLME